MDMRDQATDQQPHAFATPATPHTPAQVDAPALDEHALAAVQAGGWGASMYQYSYNDYYNS